MALKLVPPLRNRARHEATRRAQARGADVSGTLARCRADPAYLIDTFGWIEDAEGEQDGAAAGPGGVKRFRLWADQRTLVGTMRTARRLIVLKARQLGISWLACAFALWLVLFHPGKVVLFFSKGKDEAMELLRRVKFLYHRLPPELRAQLPALVKDRAAAAAWANGSRIISLPATRSAGRSFTASLAIMDEVAFMMWGEQLFSALKPTVDGGGQLFVISTANGVGGLFHGVWVKAVAAINGFVAVFLPWWSRPGRDKAWYDRQVAESNDPETVKQEYPATATEAFLVTGRVRFLADWIAKQSPHLGPGLERSAWPEGLRPLPGLTFHAHYTKGRSCLVAADVAEGQATGDACAAVVLDADTREELATLHGRWEPGEYAGYLAKLGAYYGWCPIVVERNNHGHAVLLGLRHAEYPDIACGKDGRPGWVTDKHSKPLSIDQVAEHLRDGLMIVKTQATLDEMQIYRVLDDGKTGAPEGYHDDLVMAWAVGLGWLAAGVGQQVEFY